jgi:hypothetical protein
MRHHIRNAATPVKASKAKQSVDTRNLLWLVTLPSDSHASLWRLPPSLGIITHIPWQVVCRPHLPLGSQHQGQAKQGEALYTLQDLVRHRSRGQL